MFLYDLYEDMIMRTDYVNHTIVTALCNPSLNNKTPFSYIFTAGLHMLFIN